MADAFKLTKQLEGVGFTREQAENQIQVMSELIHGELATKQDLKILELDIRGIEKNLENKMQQLEYRITIKLGTLLIVGFTTMATLMKFWLAK